MLNYNNHKNYLSLVQLTIQSACHIAQLSSVRFCLSIYFIIIFYSHTLLALTLRFPKGGKAKTLFFPLGEGRSFNLIMTVSIPRDHLISERRQNIWMFLESHLGELAPQAGALSTTPWPLGQRFTCLHEIAQISAPL